MTLELMICTIYPAGIERVAAMDLPRLPEVSYLVSWQQPQGSPIPEALSSRKDIRIITSDTVGIARNRNLALEAAQGDILLLSDDDLRYTPENLQTIISTFQHNLEIDVALFKYKGADSKIYPDYETDLSLPLPLKGWYVSEVELAFRRKAVQGHAWFDERFGIGAGFLQSGEVDTLLIQLLNKLKLKGRFFPKIITSHPPHPSTGTRSDQSLGIIRAKGVLRRLYYPWSWPLRIPLDAIRDSRAARSSFLKSLTGLIWGALYSIFKVHQGHLGVRR